jgi:hypothetical protein
VKEGQGEAIGFLCRWCLLGLACAGLAAAGYVGVLAASPHQDTPRAFLSDEIFPVTNQFWILGRLVPPPTDAPNIRFLLRVGEGVTVAEYFESEPFYASANRPAPGDFPTSVIGMPHVFLLFGADAGTLRLVAEDAKVFLIDSSLETSAGGSDPAGWTRALAAMRRRGSVALFHPGPPQAYEAYRRDLRRRGIGDPVLCALGDGESVDSTLLRARYALYTDSRRGDLATVVTDRKETAETAARLGFSARWIAPGGAGSPSDDVRVKSYPSLDRFVLSIDVDAAGR